MFFSRVLVWWQDGILRGAQLLRGSAQEDLKFWAQACEEEDQEVGGCWWTKMQDTMMARFRNSAVWMWSCPLKSHIVEVDDIGDDGDDDL